MPVHKVAGGYKWGKSGKTYKSRAGAERQARAIYAAGWHGDGRPGPEQDYPMSETEYSDLYSGGRGPR